MGSIFLLLLVRELEGRLERLVSLPAHLAGLLRTFHRILADLLLILGEQVAEFLVDRLSLSLEIVADLAEFLFLVLGQI